MGASVSQRVEFLCDNESVVPVLKSGTLRDKSLMVLLRYLTKLAICHSFSCTASSVQGKANPIADGLSRSQFSSSDAWSHMPTWPRPLFLPPFWQRFRYLDSEVSVPTYPRSCTFHPTSVPTCLMSIYRLLPLGCSCKPDGSIPQPMRRLSCALLFYWQTT